MAHALHLVAAGVPGGHQPQGKLGKIPPAADFQGKGAVQELLGRGGFLEKTLGGADHQPSLPFRQGVEGANTGHLPLTGCHGAGTNKQLPGVEPQGGNPQEGLQVAGQAVCFPFISADHHQGLSGAQGQGGGHLGLVDGGQARYRRGAAVSLHSRRQGVSFGDLQQFFQQQLHSRLLSKSQKGTNAGKGPHQPRGEGCVPPFVFRIICRRRTFRAL